MKMNQKDLKNHLDILYQKTAHIGFIEHDPISIPHRFAKKEDIELAGFFASIFAWGQRITIINKTNDLLNRMDESPYDFLLHHKTIDLKSMQGFVHRTFNETDLLYFIQRLKRYYIEDGGLEEAFSKHLGKEDQTIEQSLIGFYDSFFDVEFSPKRTRKHIASPSKQSTSKRLCMYLRWMVRKDEVDFGIWNTISPAQLMMPLDVHVERMARDLKLIQRKQRDWKTVVELTNKLRKLDPSDPVKYDFSLFGGSVMGLF